MKKTITKYDMFRNIVSEIHRSFSRECGWKPMIYPDVVYFMNGLYDFGYLEVRDNKLLFTQKDEEVVDGEIVEGCRQIELESLDQARDLMDLLVNPRFAWLCVYNLLEPQPALIVHSSDADAKRLLNAGLLRLRAIENSFYHLELNAKLYIHEPTQDK